MSISLSYQHVKVKQRHILCTRNNLETANSSIASYHLLSVHRIPRNKPTKSPMPIFSSSNGRFSFAPLVGNGTIRGEDVDIVAGTGVVTGGGVVVVGTMVADKDGVVVVVGMMGDVAGAEVTAGSVVPGESAGVATTDSDVVATDSNVVATDSNVVAATDSGVVVTTDSDVVVTSDSDDVVTTDSDIVVTTDSDVVVTTDSDVVVTTDSDVVVTTDSDVAVEGIGGKVRGGSVMHSVLKSSSIGCNTLSKLGSMGITQFPHPWIAASLPVVQRQEMAVHELYSAAAAAQASVHWAGIG